MTNLPPGNAGFDAYAASYDQALAQGLSVSGEDKSYFAQGRITWLARCVRKLSEAPGRVLDFGCGTGTATPYFFECLNVDQLTGVDISSQSIAAARQQYDSARTRFATFQQYAPCGEMDLAFCNGVFHHIPLAERATAVNYILRSLRPGGLFALWENNPWNPGTRYVMSRIPFDRDAVPLTPPYARRLVTAGGFEVLDTSFLFIFPRALKWLRGLEAPLARWPLGAQYQVLCRRPRQ